MLTSSLPTIKSEKLLPPLPLAGGPLDVDDRQPRTEVQKAEHRVSSHPPAHSPPLTLSTPPRLRVANPDRELRPLSTLHPNSPSTPHGPSSTTSSPYALRNCSKTSQVTVRQGSPACPDQSVSTITPIPLSPPINSLLGSSQASPSPKTRKGMFGMKTCHSADDDRAVPLRDASAPTTPRHESITSGSLDRKRSSGQLLNGIGKGINRVGSKMRRNLSEGGVPITPSPSSIGVAGITWSKKVRKPDILKEDEGDGWGAVRRYDADGGDSGVSRPFEIQHDLHVSPDLVGLPAEWIDSLLAQGMTEQDLLLITAAKRNQRAANNLLNPVIDIPAEGDRARAYSASVTRGSDSQTGSVSRCSAEARLDRLPDETDEELDPLASPSARPRPVPTRNIKRLSDQIKVFSQFTFDRVGENDWATDLLNAISIGAVEGVIEGGNTMVSNPSPSQLPSIHGDQISPAHLSGKKQITRNTSEPARTAISSQFVWPGPPPSLGSHRRQPRPTLSSPAPVTTPIRTSFDSFGVRHSPLHSSVDELSLVTPSASQREYRAPTSSEQGKRTWSSNPNHRSPKTTTERKRLPLVPESRKARNLPSGQKSPSPFAPSYLPCRTPPPISTSLFPSALRPHSNPQFSLPASAAASHTSSRPSSPRSRCTSSFSLFTHDHDHEHDPLANLDSAGFSERTSIALSILSSENSFGCASLHEATVQLAYTKKVLSKVGEEAGEADPSAGGVSEGEGSAMDALDAAVGRVVGSAEVRRTDGGFRKLEFGQKDGIARKDRYGRTSGPLGQHGDGRTNGANGKGR